ncbi:Uncharacterised protein [Escherichia coli]|nr:Uncharacterised protein [Escherichia coli]
MLCALRTGITGRRELHKGIQLLPEAVCCSIPHQLCVIFRIQRPERGQRVAVLIKTKSCVPWRTGCLTMLQTGNGLLEYKLAAQAFSQWFCCIRCLSRRFLRLINLSTVNEQRQQCTGPPQDNQGKQNQSQHLQPVKARLPAADGITVVNNGFPGRCVGACVWYRSGNGQFRAEHDTA